MTELWWVMGGCGLPGTRDTFRWPPPPLPLPLSVVMSSSHSFSPDCVGDRWIRNDRKIWGGREIWSRRRMERKGVSWRGWHQSRKVGRGEQSFLMPLTLAEPELGDFLGWEGPFITLVDPGLRKPVELLIKGYHDINLRVQNPTQDSVFKSF